MDSLLVKVYNKNYVTVVPKDSINIVVKDYSVSYRDQIWVGLVMLFVLICVYAFKKQPVATTTIVRPAIEEYRDNTSALRPKQADINIDVTKTTPKIDMSQLGDINIKNEKL